MRINAKLSLGTVAATAASIVLVAGWHPPGAVAATPIYEDTNYTFAERAADLVSRMTLAEKVAQLHTNSAPAISRLGVQQYTYWSEGQHGINTLGANTNNGGVGGGPRATSFPTNFASTMSWDPSLMYQETTAIADEARGFLDKSLWNTGQNNIGPDRNGYGSLTYWAPTVNMSRDPRWGRNDEAFGEDPYLVAQMAGAFVNGYQGQSQTGESTSPYLKVLATAKHYALNDVEANRNSGSSDTTETNIRDYYTSQFADLIKDAKVSGLMTSYNAVNGTPAPVNTYLVNEVAERTYGFDGYSTSDCGAVGDVYWSTSHKWAPPGWTTDGNTWTNNTTRQQISAGAGAQAYSARAGTQLNCTGGEYTLGNINAAISAGILSEGVIDDALVRVFTMRMRTGEFDPVAQQPYTQITKSVIQNSAHQELARKVAANSLVLLKNDNVSGTSAPLLPANPASLRNVVIVGNLANTVTLGSYSGSPSYTTNAVQGITAAVRAANPSASVVFDGCGSSTTSGSAANCSTQTQTAIRTADLVVVFAGTDGGNASEGRDRGSIAMPGNQTSLINQVAGLGNPRMVLALQAVGPVAVEAVRGSYPAMLFSGYNGQAQGAALADVLFGRQNPSGHLDFTWYSGDSQLPGMTNYGLTPAQTGGLGRTYQYFTGTPTYPFGYGLSYSRFAYNGLTLSAAQATGDDTVTVSFTVTNTGAAAGATVAQLYASTPTVTGAEQDQPAKRLAGFAKTRVLAPDEAQQITLTLRPADLSVWNNSTHRQEVPRGQYSLFVGPDSATKALQGSLQVTTDATPTVKLVTVQPDRVVFTTGQQLDLTADNPWIHDVTGQASQHVPATRIVEAANSDQSFLDLATATVTYRSSNPSVATVSSNGVVSMLAVGAATISATVNGVTGSTPVVVTDAPPPSSTSAVRNTSSGRCLDVNGASQTNGTATIIWDCNGQTNQTWTSTTAQELSVYGSKCLDANGAGTANGTPVIIWDCNGQSNQQWRFNTDGTITGIGSGRCLDVVSNGTANGTNVQIWDCAGAASQKWNRN